MATLARATGQNFVTHANSTGDDADPINDTHDITDRLIISDFQWWADGSCDVYLHIGGDVNKSVHLLSESTETSGAALAGTVLAPDDVLAIDITGTTYKGYRIILSPWKDFYQGA